MKTTLRMPDRNGHFATFEGADGRGTFLCRDIVPLSITSHLGGMRFGDIVAIDNPAGKWLASAIIVSAEPSAGGTRFDLAF